MVDGEESEGPGMVALVGAGKSSPLQTGYRVGTGRDCAFPLMQLRVWRVLFKEN